MLSQRCYRSSLPLPLPSFSSLCLHQHSCCWHCTVSQCWELIWMKYKHIKFKKNKPVCLSFPNCITGNTHLMRGGGQDCHNLNYIVLNVCILQRLDCNSTHISVYSEKRQDIMDRSNISIFLTAPELRSVPINKQGGEAKQ